MEYKESWFSDLLLDFLASLEDNKRDLIKHHNIATFSPDSLTKAYLVLDPEKQDATFIGRKYNERKGEFMYLSTSICKTHLAPKQSASLYPHAG